MDKIFLTDLYAAKFEITDVDCYEHEESVDRTSTSKRHQLKCYGTALASSQEIEIFFFWHAFSYRPRYQSASHFALEMDDAGIITADINRTLVLDHRQQELDPVDANTILIHFINEEIDWKPAVLSGLPQPRFGVVD